MGSPREKKYPCPHCGEKQYNPKDVTAHMVREHEAEMFVCSQVGCNKKYPSERALERHVQESHSGSSFSCSRCPYTCPRRENMKRHEKSCSKKRGRAGHADNTSAVSGAVPAPVPALPAPPMTPATDNSAGVIDPALEFTPGSTPSSGLAIGPNHTFPFFVPTTLEQLWDTLWQEAIDMARARHPHGGYDHGLINLEHEELKTLILQEANNGLIDGTTAGKWLQTVDNMAFISAGPSRLNSRDWYQ